MDALVLVAGDGDFKDMLDFVSEQLQKKIIIFGLNSCTSKILKERASEGCFIALDEIWEHISEPRLNPEESTNRAEGQSALVCKWFLEGKCRFGDKCLSVHPKDDDPIF